MNTVLTPKVEQLIRERLQRGSHRNAEEVIEDAFEALRERENYDSLMAELQEADEQIAKGEFTDYDEHTIGQLAEDVRTRGLRHLAEERDLQR